MEPLGVVDSRECVCSRLPPGAEYVAAVELPRPCGEEYKYCVSFSTHNISSEIFDRRMLHGVEANCIYRLWVMSAISGLMYGTQYFQEKDLPLYSRGLEIMIGVSAAGLVLAGVQVWIYTIYNRKTKALKESGLVVEGKRYNYIT